MQLAGEELGQQARLAARRTVMRIGILRRRRRRRRGRRRR